MLDPVPTATSGVHAPRALLAAILACLAALCATAGAPATAASQPEPGPAAEPKSRQDGGVTPIARPGSELASRRALSASELRSELADALRDAGGASGAWVFDTEAASDPLLFSEGANAERIPASNQKLLTTAAFIDEFGAGGRLETRAYASGRLGGPGRSVLAGDLVVVGDGDPALGTARFARAANQPVTRIATLARDVARAGVERIKGRILADDSIFDRIRRDGPYLSPLSGLSFNNGYAGGDYARNPELEAAKALKQALRRRGVRVAGKVGRANLPAAALREEPLASVASPAAAALIEETNVPSNNFFAEMLLKRLGASDGKRGTRKRGNRKVEAFARRIGIRAEVSDGSGLSRKNQVSAESVGRLLVEMAKPGADATAFRDSLAIAGREGTLADRMRGTAAEGNCAAKTGTISGVSALSGYCEAANHTVAFAVLNNKLSSVDGARLAQDRIAAAIARYEP